MKIKEGSIYIYYIFDVASEIHLEKLEKIMGRKPVESQIECAKVTPKYVKYARAPYLLKFGKKALEVEGKKYEFEVSAKLFEFGVISIRMTLPYSGDLENLEELSKDFSGNLMLEKEATKYVDRIKKEISDAIFKPMDKYFIEDYMIFQVKDFDKPVTAKELLKDKKNTLARILRSEGKVDLSPEETERSLNSNLSYFPDDLVIVDWNAAFVYDPRVSWDTLDVLEYANMELLELMAYDSILDKEMDATYDASTAKRGPLLILSPFSSAIHRLEETKLDVIQITEKVENALKLVGDQYLAKVYSAAADAFFLNEWKTSVRRKLEILDSIYSTLYNKVQTERMVVLETLIVILIVFETIVAFWPG
ncbi:MAG: hypothetical protein QW112_03005 [Candidatus Micrarchaeia archaeon]